MWGESGREHLLGIQPEKRRGGSNVRSGGGPCWQGEGCHRREDLKAWLGGRLDPGKRTSSHRACDQTILWRCRPGKLTAGETCLREIHAPLGPHPGCPTGSSNSTDPNRSHVLARSWPFPPLVTPTSVTQTPNARLSKPKSGSHLRLTPVTPL